MVRRSGVDDVLLPWQFESLFRTAASIKDPQLATEMCGLLTFPSRLGSRNAETLHTCEDYLIRLHDGTIVGYQIPTGLECDETCPVCRELAKQRAADADDDDIHWKDFIDQYWSPKSHAGGRKIPVLTERVRGLLDLYTEFHGPRPQMSEQTYRNRLLRLEELCNEVDVNIYPQALRATAVNYWVLQGLQPADLKIMFGWKYLSTGVYYIQKSDLRLRVSMQRALGQEPDHPYQIYDHPPTFSEVRPDSESDLIKVEQLTPDRYIQPSDSDADADPLEAHAQTALENTTLDDFFDSGSEKSEARSPLLTIAATYVDTTDRIGEWITTNCRDRLGYTISDWFMTSTYRMAIGLAAFSVFSIVMFLFSLVDIGVLNPSTGDLSVNSTFIFSLMIVLYITSIKGASVFDTDLPAGIGEVDPLGGV
jgi:hypothetical protein